MKKVPEKRTTPPRRRSIETEGNEEVSAEVKQAAKEFYFANKEMNRLKKEAGSARKTLYKLMKAAGLKVFTFLGTEKGQSVQLKAELGPGRPGNEVDMEKLRKLVGDDEKFFAACTITKSNVMDHFGGNISDQVCTSVLGEECAKVGPKS